MVKLKNLLKESSPGFENRQFGDPLPKLKDITKKYQEKNGIKEETLNEAPDKTGNKIYKVYDINAKLGRDIIEDLRDQVGEMVKIGADYAIFQNAQGTAKVLKQIKRLLDKI